MNRVKFYRGLEQFYNVERFGSDALYFATDTGVLYLNDVKYGFDPDDENLNLLSVVEWASPDTIVFTCTNGKTVSVTLPTASISADGVASGGLMTALDKETIATLADVYVTREELQNYISGIYHFRGVIDSISDLPTENNYLGDVYRIREDFELNDVQYSGGTNVVYTENGWEAMENTSEDLDNYVAWTEDSSGNKLIILPKGSKIIGTMTDNDGANLLQLGIYDTVSGQIEQVELGSTKLHLTLNSSDRPSIDLPDGSESLAYVSDFITYNLGNFDTLDALSLQLGYHNYYNNADRIVYYFTIANTDMGMVINNMGDMVDGLPYTSRQYMYYQEHRYTRTVRRNSTTGSVTATDWVIEDNVTLSGKGVDFYKLAQLTTESTDAEIQDALTYPNGNGVVTEEDLKACIEKGMFLKEYNSNVQLIVGMAATGVQYTITYMGYPVTGLGVNTSANPIVSSVLFTITDGVYAITKAANTAEVLTTDWDKYPLEIKIPIWNSSLTNSVYSESTILSWFGCNSIAEFKTRSQNTSLLSLLYLNSGNMYYRIPVQFIEFNNSDNQIHIVTSGLDMYDDSAARLEITINVDGTVFDGTSSNVQYIKSSLASGASSGTLSIKYNDEEVASYDGSTNVDANLVVTAQTVPGLDDKTVYDNILEINNTLTWIDINDSIYQGN